MSTSSSSRGAGPSAPRASPPGTAGPGRGLLLLEVDGAGGHPAAWRTCTAPASVLTPVRLRAVVLAAENAGFHAATFSDPSPSSDGNGKDAAAGLNALQRAAFAGPITRSIALIPEVDTVYTEPFHVSTQLASLDYVSGGRAGWLVAASTSPADAAAAGRNTVRGHRVGQEAADSIEAGRRLWDSWEDDAVIRDVPTGRYLDVDKLHYADFHSTPDADGRNYSVKGPSIIPRPLQGQLPVLAPAGLLAPEAVAGGAVDALLVSAPTPELLAAELTATRESLSAAPATPGGPALIAELDVVLDARGQSAVGRLALLDGHARWRSPRARFVGTAAELIELLVEVLAVADGIRLHPAVLDTDLEELARLVLPELRLRGVLAPVERDATFREQLGLTRPASRYAPKPAAFTASAGN
ncbi:alkanesulfonate monooxygenase SsuD/methylene tetrahydromethanopterin reductase-like flavin-dependent oxidoreductase (luciferase family) [Arthrobacter sp. V4I6]|uniref:LLM class flavin-dependent oxidoreductase n=1 Tax=unclassified Arthrobacter TaxID=235627 RepID=UPI0027874283|nr:MULTISPECIES: LLM class flavin-dependent oxidoreductase [unclassified Arthrobacter]MDQ0823256.1 alkanesulfonate monooxygenase SsuD/methylene tetrahydromethanopterin reductase-like flavin-dependent oxidoreductase (luciferase family) [Arthrobacter sp. V1I7]MDQ0852887.1 alkanesulfonate monooxygenase SsuD/methylene tetrahydromethanopterin reductase-like flavin-dependent oxidoreductase (luciferase family) [Arthrobacter sp. V4I6]